jgi:hypothetical protein
MPVKRGHQRSCGARNHAGLNTNRMSVPGRFCCKSRRSQGWAAEAISLGPLSRQLWRDRSDAQSGYEAHGPTAGGGLGANLASRRRFCAIAASVNSSCAPQGPRNRRRFSRRIRLRCANSISTRFRSWRDCPRHPGPCIFSFGNARPAVSKSGSRSDA